MAGPPVHHLDPPMNDIELISDLDPRCLLDMNFPIKDKTCLCAL